MLKLYKEQSTNNPRQFSDKFATIFRAVDYLKAAKLGYTKAMLIMLMKSFAKYLTHENALSLILVANITKGFHHCQPQ